MSNHEFEMQVKNNIKALGLDPLLKQKAMEWAIEASEKYNYTYNFSWGGLPIIQFPQDLMAMQEIFWLVKPDLVIETGIARGGSLAFWSSFLCLLDTYEGLDPRKSTRKVVGVDIDIRPHNRKALDEHPLRFKMELIEGSSIDPDIIQQVRSHADGGERVLVSLDSNHTHEHVLAELNAYADLVSVGSYCIVFDTAIEDLAAGSFPDRPWDVGNNPKTAVHEWLKNHPEFEIDKDIDNKLLISVAPDGYLKRIEIAQLS
ncbi:cephalosporin hydroxylase family protein [Synechococcus sp. AH-551-N17]|nr:cephalosporin hydroxylase family protein [Synechococcus sp. AH-551-N17]